MDFMTRCKALCLEQALKRILPLGAWQETAERLLCHFHRPRNVQLFQVPNIHEISQIRKSKPLESFHVYFSYLFLISYNGLSVFRKLQLRPRYGFKPDVGDLRDGLRISCSTYFCPTQSRNLIIQERQSLEFITSTLELFFDLNSTSLT